MKLNKLVENSIKILYALFLIWINICVLFCAANTRYTHKKKFLFNNITILLIGFILLAAGMALAVMLLRRMAINFSYCVLAGTVILFILQIYTCKNIYFETAWDARVMVTAARQIGNGVYQGEFDTYFSYYPNNLFLTTLLSFGCKAITCLGDVTRQQYLLPIIVVQCLISCITGILIYKSIKVLVNEKWALGGWLLYVALLGLNPWLVIVYSDSMSLFFSIACFYLYLTPCRGWREAAKWAVMAILGGIGYLIKPQTVIVLIACIILSVLRLCTEQERRFLRISYIGIVVVFFAGIQYLGDQLTAYSGVEVTEEMKMPMTHWAMMGLNPKTHGAYASEDVKYTQSFASADEMKKADWKVIRERITEYGAAGMAEHLKKKTLINYADGTFAWRCEGSFFHTLFPDINSKVSGKLKDLFYYGKSPAGKLRETFVHGIWLQILFWMLPAVMFAAKPEEKNAVSAALVTILGTVLFSLLFEARARYLMCNASVYIVLAILGMRAVYERIRLGKVSIPHPAEV